MSDEPSIFRDIPATASASESLALVGARLLTRIGWWLVGRGGRVEKHIICAHALRVGTCVKLLCRGCGYTTGHDGVWFVVRYNYDSDDYTLSRDPNDEWKERTYARLSAMNMVRP